MFIVIDGIDGTGKGTQVAELEKYFKNIGKKVLVLDFPRYEEESSFFVKKYLNAEYGNNISAKKASIFYALDRFDALHNYEELFKDYDIILSNRYVSANMIHQSANLENFEEIDEFLNWIEDLEFNIFGIPKPDKTFFLNVPFEFAEKLISAKSQRNYIKTGNKDLHEKDENHLKKAYNSGIYVAKKENWEIIDCLENGEILKIEKITEKLLERIVKL